MKQWQLYLAYDDAALQQFANPGLLRRAKADVAQGGISGTLEVASSAKSKSSAGDTQIFRVQLDDATVELPTTGVQHARCSCPAPAACKHKVAAVLWLQQQLQTGALTGDSATVDAAPAAEVVAGQHDDASVSLQLMEPQPGKAPSDVADHPPLDLHAEILALPLAQLLKQAPIAIVRRCAELLPDCQIKVHAYGAQLHIDIAPDGVMVRYLHGGGLAAMLCDAPKPQLWCLLAVLSIWQQAQRQLPWPQGVIVAEADDSTCGLQPEERALVLECRAHVEQLLALGLDHVATASIQALQTFALSAKVEGLPRLAAILRNTVGMLLRFQQREHDIDASQLLSQLARLFAFTQSLLDDATGQWRGQRQRDFQLQPTTLQLQSVGAYWWHNPSGARGLTWCCVDLNSSRLVTLVHARPNDADPLFRPDFLYFQQSQWQGGSIAALSQLPFELQGARLSQDGVLAASPTHTQVRPLAALLPSDPRWQGVGLRRWCDLVPQINQLDSLHGQGQQLVLLRPTALRWAGLDDKRQRYVLIAQDSNGDCLALTCSAGASHDQLSRRLFDMTQKAEAKLILVRVQRAERGDEPDVEPFAVVLEHADGLRCYSLQFDELASHSRQLSWRQWFKPKHTAPAKPLFPYRAGDWPSLLRWQSSLASQLAQQLWPVFEAVACTGRSQLTELQRERLVHVIAQLEGMGLWLIARPLQQAQQQRQLAPSALLQLSYLLQRLQHLLPA